MDGVNQNNKAQQAPAEQPEQSKKNVSDKQANDFADKLNKEKKDKSGGKKEDQSLESLLSERSKNGKNVIEGRLKDQQKDGQQGESQNKESMMMGELGISRGADAQLKTDLQIREMQQVASTKEVNAALQKMADQIHVSSKDAVNGAEIRISLKDSVLPGTEVRIQRHGGELTVTLNTTSVEANNFLAAHEASLQKSLAEKFAGEKINVNINLSGGDNPEDGRSRNEYTGDSDEQEDKE